MLVSQAGASFSQEQPEAAMRVRALPRRAITKPTAGALRTCLLAMLSLVAPAACALDPETSIADYALHVWQESGGLAQSHVRTIVQTRDGYLWIGTKAGLARFDGVRFIVFNDHVPNQLLEGEVWALKEDQDGALWIGTFGGGLSRYKDGRFTTFTRKEGLTSNFIGALAECKEGGLWIGTDDKGLSFLKDGRFTSYSTKDGLLHNRVNALHCDDKGTLWIGTAKGLSALTSGKFTNYPLDLEGEGRITGVVGDGSRGLWLGLGPHGLAHFEAGTVTRYTARDGLASDEVGGVYLDSRGTLWIATSRGLCRRRLDRFSCSSDQAGTDSLSTVALRSLQAPMEDREGNLWVGSGNQGLMRFKDSPFAFYGAEQGLPGDGTRVVLETRDGTLWIGGVDGLSRLTGGHVTRYGTSEGLSNTSIRTLFEDLDGSLWIGTAVGLNVLRDGKIVQVKDSGLGKAFVYGVLRDRRGDLWVGTSNYGLFRGHGNRYTVYTSADGLDGSQIRCLRQDGRGDIWIGTKDGALTCWHEGQFTRYGPEQGLAGDSVNSLYVDGEDALWVGTRHGLSRIKNGRIASYDARNGLPENLIYQMIEDGVGDMWLTCSRGIFRIPKTQLAALLAGTSQRVNCVAYGSEMGARGTAPAVGGYPSILRDREGSLWFAHLRGLSLLDPRRNFSADVAFPTRIEEILVDSRLEPASADGAPPAFGPGDGRVEIHYTALHLYAPEKMTFRYRLEGLDSQWTDAQTRRVAYYTNLPPGNYRFEVEATNFKGVKAAQPAVFKFSLKPHFYQARWFQGLAALALVLLAFAAHRIRVARHERAEAELQRRVDDAVANLDLLDGLLPICAWCKKVREDTGYWSQVEAYVSAHSRAQFSHGICPDCAKNVYGAARGGQ
jgi:ligand-binding sensor domain-containing protein